MPALLRRFIVPIIFATIFIVIPLLVIGLSTRDAPIIEEEPASGVSTAAD